MFECDNGNVIDYVRGENHRPHISKPLVSAIKQALNRPWEVIFIKILREANGAANSIAQRAHNLTKGLHYYQQPPVELLHILHFDKNGGTQPRLCNPTM